MIHVMHDLETWGKKPGCDLRSIGACVFDPLTGLVHDGSLGTIRPFYQAVDNPQYGWNAPRYKALGSSKYPLVRDPETVAWWADQSNEAQAAFANPIDLAEGLHAFSAWLFALTDQLYDRFEIVKCKPSASARIWSHGPHFDTAILEAAYDACDIEVPWHYRSPRDTRTAFDMAGIDDHSALLASCPGPLGIKHHALDDSISQALAVCVAFKEVRS